MKTTVKHISDTKVEVTIELTSEELAIAEQVAITKLARDVKVAGFRKGKTPVAVAAKNIDPAALSEETINNAMSKAVAESFPGNNLQAIDRPMVAIKKFVPGEILEFTATADILPNVKLGDYKKLKVAREKVVVSDDDVNETIERIRTSLSERKDVDRAAQNGDEVVIDFVGKKDGVEFPGGKGDDYPLTLGSNQFIPGFEEGIVGHKPGETFDLDLTFPADYQAEDLKGAKVVFTTTLKLVKEVVLPEVDDKLAAKAGPFKSLDDLKVDIRRELETQKQRENEDNYKDALVGKLIEASNVPVPEVLVEDQTTAIEQDFTRNLSYRGMTIDQYFETKGYKSRDEWVKAEVHEAAERRVKAGLALAELSKVEKIEASLEEVEAQIARFKEQYANNTEALKQFDEPDVRLDIGSRLITEKTVDRLVELNSK